jgi:copper chaperone
MADSKLTVPEMRCDACRSAIGGALERVEGVEDVNVDLQTKLVTVRHAGDVRLESLRAAVEAQGYDVTAAEPA